jgi:hypothetical protein
MTEVISEAAVTVAVHEVKYKRILCLSRPLQASKKAIPTAEYFQLGKRTHIFSAASD